jgi:hypothetical protein
MAATSISMSNVTTSTPSLARCWKSAASAIGTSRSSPGYGTCGAAACVCGRIGRCGCTATPRRETSCLERGCMLARSILNACGAATACSTSAAWSVSSSTPSWSQPGRKSRAEPFISYFFHEYSSHFPKPGAAFASITARAPFYMGLNHLRIARNDYVTESYGARLVRQARGYSAPVELRACDIMVCPARGRGQGGEAAVSSSQPPSPH